ncbi:MAG TPA: hypothetical protein VF190_13770, partial [Rhodothermales bacterium]
GRGFIPRREEGRLITSGTTEVALFDRGMRETARKLTGLLTDAVVAAVSISGADRALLTFDSGAEVRVGDVSWLVNLLEKRVIPVVSMTTRVGNATTELPPGATLAGIAGAIGAIGVGFFARGGRIPGGEPGQVGRGIRLAGAASEGLITEPTVAAELVRRGAPIYLLTPHTLRSEDASGWTLLEGGL